MIYLDNSSSDVSESYGIDYNNQVHEGNLNGRETTSLSKKNYPLFSSRLNGRIYAPSLFPTKRGGLIGRVSLSKKGHSDAAMGFLWIAAGAAIVFIPLPGAAQIGTTLIIKGAIDASKAIAEEELENKENGHPHPNDPEPPVGVSIGIPF